GRRRKNCLKGPEHLERAFMIMDAYCKARAAGLKHSTAVAETVDVVRQLDREIPISNTEVRRVLAELRPQGSPVELRVEYSTLEGEEAAARRHFFTHMAEFAGTK